MPMDKEQRREHLRRIGKIGGKRSVASPKHVYPFRDRPGLAQQAGKAWGYTFKRRDSKKDEKNT